MQDQKDHANKDTMRAFPRAQDKTFKDRSMTYAGLQHCLHPGGVDRRAEKIALGLLASVRLEKRGLPCMLDTFIYDTLVQAPAHAGDGADEGAAAFGLRIDRPDKGLVDLEYIDRKLIQVAQAGVTNAEVIHSDLHAHRLELASKPALARHRASGRSQSVRAAGMSVQRLRSQ